MESRFEIQSRRRGVRCGGLSARWGGPQSTRIAILAPCHRLRRADIKTSCSCRQQSHCTCQRVYRSVWRGGRWSSSASYR